MQKIYVLFLLVIFVIFFFQGFVSFVLIAERCLLAIMFQVKTLICVMHLIYSALCIQKVKMYVISQGISI